MIRVLQVVTYMGRGGLETLLMNYYRHIDRNQVQFDFLTHRSFEADYDREILSAGGRIYHLPRLNPASMSYRRELGSFFDSHPEYRIVHSHLDCMAGIPLREAMKHNVPVRIAHAHSSSQVHDLRYPVKLFCKSQIPKSATHLFACGEAAGKWMFGGKDFQIVRNAVDVGACAFDPAKRAKARSEFGVGDQTLLLGHVGRFRREKNHAFLLEAFSEFQKQRPDSMLLLAGDGDMEQEMQQYARSLGLQESVIFAGARSDVPDLLSAMDIFCLPSLFEGLPLSVMEAQAAGLPCILSDGVPAECCVTENTRRIPLETSRWAGEIGAAADLLDRAENLRILRAAGAEAVRSAGFDICENAAKLQEFYLQCYEDNGSSNSGSADETGAEVEV